MNGQERTTRGVVLERPSSPGEEEARCKICGQPLPHWRPGVPLICPDHNPNRGRPTREGRGKCVSFEEWLQGTLWFVAAP